MLGGIHFCLEFLKLCREHKIKIVLRPPHTSQYTNGQDAVQFWTFRRVPALPLTCLLNFAPR